MPTTEAGKRLLQARLEEFGDLCDDGLANRERLPFMEQVYRDDIDAIEAEATRDMVPVGKAVESIVATKNEAVAAERARIRATVETTDPRNLMPSGSRVWIDRAAVLAIIDGEDTDG